MCDQKWKVVAALTKSSVLVVAFRRQERIQQVLTVAGNSVSVITDTGESH